MTAHAIGFTRPDAPCPNGARIEPVEDGLAAVLCDVSLGARQKLRLCLELHARAEAFLPLPLRMAVSPEAAAARVRSDPAALHAGLATAQREVEARICMGRPGFAAPPCPPGPNGRTWLRARRNALAARDAAEARVAQDLRRIAREAGARSVAIDRSRRGIFATAILPRSALARLTAALSPTSPDGALLVSGPWPLFSVADRWCP